MYIFYEFAAAMSLSILTSAVDDILDSGLHEFAAAMTYLTMDFVGRVEFYRF